MDKKELTKILSDHKKWYNGNGGKRADLRGAYLREVDLRRADLRGVDLREVDLRGVDLREVDLRGVDLREVDLRGVYLRGVDLRGADLRGADLREVDLRGVYLRGAYLREVDLRGADLRGADLRGADLRGAYLRRADLRESKLGFQMAKKFLSNKTLMNKMFKSTKNYWVCYKSFHENYTPPKKWSVGKGATIKNRIDDTRSELCSYGINVGTLGWCKKHCDNNIWEIHVTKQSEVCVPYFTDGKVRVSEAKLIKIIGVK